MQNKYHFSIIEKITQQYWISINAYKIIEYAKNKHGDNKKKFFACSMIPYPSGKLHMGHVRNYTINDVMYRYLRMNDYNVLMPMGWDAFGMPAENAAIINNISPAKWTYANIAYMKKQMQAIGLAIDWSREITSCDPQYYKWNQWIFLKMLENGIIYKKTGIVNWDPIDKTVLANEQVINGRGWRSGALITKRKIPMYYARITKYANELLKYINNKLPGWPERVRLMQINWIGKSIGVRLSFLHTIKKNSKLINSGKLWVFTTRVDTIMGVTFCAIAPEHSIASFAAKSCVTLKKFIIECKKDNIITNSVKTIDIKGVPTNLFVIHPLTGEKISIWISNYVLMTSNEGAIMGVPAHNEKDFLFAKKYHLQIKPVITVAGKIYNSNIWEKWYSDTKYTATISSGKYSGLTFYEATCAITTDLITKGVGEQKTVFHLHDWGISRQRYWGTPIPMIKCDNCGDVPVLEKDLPVLLPENCTPDNKNNPLHKNTKFLFVHCPQCNKLARRETDTMDTFVDSAWYYMRYTSPNNTENMVDSNNEYWMPIDQYIGGIEHAVLHLLYARFWTKVMRDLDLVKFDEPFTNLLTQGMVLNETYYRETIHGKKNWFNPADINLIYNDKNQPISAILKEDGKSVKIGNVEKMSKSKNNGIDPQIQIDLYGADTTRLFIIFSAPPEKNLIWSNAGLEGAYRFLHRVWNFFYRYAEHIKNATAGTLNVNLLNFSLKELRFKIHKILQQVTYDFERTRYNTVVSGSMKMLNTLETMKIEDNCIAHTVLAECTSIFLRILNPITPHITHTLWQELGFFNKLGDILDAQWPKVDHTALVQNEVTLIIQINGKLRGSVILPKNVNKETATLAALANENVKKFLINTPKKIIFIPEKLINIVI